MKLTFWGATRQVTGSMHLVTLDSGYNILLDCGLQYEKGDPFELNATFPFNPSEIDLLILTHAHIDHSGNIPTLIKQGYKGQILCTEPTAALVENLLHDSVNVQMAESKSKRKGSRGRHRIRNQEVLYGQKDVLNTLDRIVTVKFKQVFKINGELEMVLYPAGHILGAASVQLRIKEEGRLKTLGFTGDLGKTGAKIVVDPEPMPQLDYLITECTYGNRLHTAVDSAEEELYRHVKKNCIDAPGRLVIPAFSVGRTQAILFTLNQLYVQGKLNGITVFSDSTLGILSTRVHAQYDEFLNQETKDFFGRYGDLFEFPNLRIIQTESDQKAMQYHSGPCIIVSSAGMIEGGRIQQHVRNNIQDPLCTILIAGYCAEGTLGHRLLMGQPTIQIKNRECPVYARIRSTDVFSAHPDREGLTEYLNASKNEQLKHVFLVHGESGSMNEFAGYLTTLGFKGVTIPERGDQFTL